MFNLKKYGEHLIAKKRTEVIENDEKQLFIDLVDTFEMLNKRSLSVESDHGLKLEKYDGLFYLLIENLFYLHYGEWKAELIMWYVYDRIDDKGKTAPLLFFDEIDNEESQVIIKNAKELYSFLNKVERKIKKNKKK